VDLNLTKKGDKMFCTLCGNKISIESKFCSGCGSLINRENSLDITNENINLNKSTQTESHLILNKNSSSNSDNFVQMFKKLPKSTQNIVWLVLILLILAIQYGPNLMSSSGSSLSSVVGQTAANQIPGLVMATVPEVEQSCSEALTSSTMWCTFGFAVKNSGSTATRLYGDVYALVDGLTFKSTDVFGGSTYVSTDINPGQTQSAIVTFEVPRGSTISNVFIADSAESGLTGAKVIADLNIVAN
jgi:hypothetical protein